ncbi:MAG: hypothetical protein ACKOXM_06180 [Agromyces sp.]
MGELLLEQSGEQAWTLRRINFFFGVGAIAPLTFRHAAFHLGNVLAATSPRGLAAHLARNG